MEKIVATGGHPFWVQDGEDLADRPLIEELDCSVAGGAVSGRWVDARDLRIGDLLIGRKVGPVAVESVEVAEEAELATYNLHVAGVHTYTVGLLGLWVHNMSKGRGRGRQDRKCKKKGPPVLTAANKNKAIKILRDYERLAEERGVRLPPRRIEELNRLRDAGTISTSDLPATLLSEFPSELAGRSLRDIQRLPVGTELSD